MRVTNTTPKTLTNAPKFVQKPYTTSWSIFLNETILNFPWMVISPFLFKKQFCHKVWCYWKFWVKCNRKENFVLIKSYNLQHGSMIIQDFTAKFLILFLGVINKIYRYSLRKKITNFRNKRKNLFIFWRHLSISSFFAPK